MRSATAPIIPWFSRSHARPRSAGNSSTGRPHWPYAITTPAPPIDGASSSTWSRRIAPHAPEQLGEVGVEGIAPRGEVVQVAHLAQAPRVPLPGERRGHHAVVLHVLLERTARECHRHRPARALAQRGPHESHDAPPADEAGLLRVEARQEEAPRLQEQPVEGGREAALN